MRKCWPLLICLGIQFLSGCGNQDDVINDFLNAQIEGSITTKSGFESDDDYLRYEQIKQVENINEDGFYFTDDVDYSVLEDTDAIHVTFATNSFISVRYYDNVAMTSPIEESGTYMHKNDCIYASIDEISNPYTDAYSFMGFEIWEFDENGNKKKELESEPYNAGFWRYA